MSTNGPTAKPTIVLIHGLWLTPRSWEGWIDRYQKAGYKVLAPSWPGLEGEVEAIRKDPSPLKGLKLKTVVDHYDRIIRKLDAQAILMGHSFGGLIVKCWSIAASARPVSSSPRRRLPEYQCCRSRPSGRRSACSAIRSH